MSRGTRTGGRCRTNARYAAISCRYRSAQAGETSSKTLATAVVRPVVPTSRTDRPLRRSTWTGANSGQIRCTEASAVRSCAPCGPDRSSLPLSGWVPVPRPAGSGRRLAPVPDAGGLQVGAATRLEGAVGPYGGGHGGRCCVHDGSDPFVRRRVAYAFPSRTADTLGSATRLPFNRTTPAGRPPGRGGAFLPDTRARVADHMAPPGEAWRIVARHLTPGYCQHSREPGGLT